MKTFKFCIIDDEQGDRGWRLYIIPLIESLLLQFKKSDRRPDELLLADFPIKEFIVHYSDSSNDGTRKALTFDGPACYILTTGGKLTTTDDVLSKAMEVDAHIYLMDVDLTEFIAGTIIDEPEIGGLMILNELHEKEKFKDAFKVIYSAKNLSKTIFKALPKDPKVSHFVIGKSNEGQRLLEHLDLCLLKLQTAILGSFSLAEIEEISQPLTLITSGDLDEFLVAIDRETSSGWSFRSLFPKQAHSILAYSDVKNDPILGEPFKESIAFLSQILEVNFRKTVAKCIGHEYVLQNFQILCAKDFIKKKKNGTDEIFYNSLRDMGKVNSEEEAKSGIRETNFSTIGEKLYDFFKGRKKANNNYRIEIAEPKWAIDCKEMITHYGIYHEQLLYISKVALLNIMSHQEPVNGDLDFPPLVITSEIDPTSNELIIDIQAGKVNGHIFDFDSGRQSIVFHNAFGGKTGLLLTQFSGAKLQFVDGENLEDLIKLVCYLWRSEFTYIAGDKGVTFKWDVASSRIIAKEITVDNNHHIRYIIKCDKVHENRNYR